MDKLQNNKEVMLTDAQLGIYLECIAETNSSSYCLPVIFTFSKEGINAQKLAEAFDYTANSFDAFSTPLGEVYVHKDLTRDMEKMGYPVIDAAFTNEHSIEVQLPFIKQFMPNPNIVPVLVGSANPQIITDIIAKYWDNENIGFVISSDLSHFYNRQEASRIDAVTADMIENNITENFLPQQACGYVGICGLLNFAAEKKFSLIRVGITDSAEKTNDQSSVVGYGAWYLAEQEKCSFLVQNFANTIKNLCAISIKTQLENVTLKVENYPRALETKNATFVTLEIGGNLRGCIGSVVPFEPLIVDLCKNARNAAFKDPRFIPVEMKEFDKLEMTISLLSKPVPYKFTSEEDLLNQIQEGVDGVIIKDIGRQALYLPEVWSQIPDKKEFFNSLKLKAGLKPDWFSDTFEAYRFTTCVVK